MKHLLAATLLLLPGFAFAQPNFETPKAVTIDKAVLAELVLKTAELQKAVDAIPASVPVGVRNDVVIYLKAADWIVRHGEFFSKDSPKQTLAVIEAGVARARAAAKGQAPWRDVRGKAVIRAYASAVDGSLQPYSVLVPEGFEKVRRIDVVLHGRDQTLTESRFIVGKEAAKGGSKTDHVVIEVYGRGNNAYRWAGEQDVFEALANFRTEAAPTVRDVSEWPVILRGFSMGGAGTWHLGLQHPSAFAAISPGAGFTTTHGYIKGLPKLPDYQERCLHIYDAVDYAENAFDVPIVAYSGGNDPQKAAADNIENALKGFKEPLRFTHIVAPGLEHKQPPEWLAKIEAEFQKYLAAGPQAYPNRVRFVTYTLRYPTCSWVVLEGLERHYDRALVDAQAKGAEGFDVKTINVTRLRLTRAKELGNVPVKVVIDGQAVDAVSGGAAVAFEKTAGKWAAAKANVVLRKSPGLQGPIDDVFHTPFRVVGPTGKGWSEATDRLAKSSLARFGREWDKYFRGLLPTGETQQHSALLFGDPGSNPAIKAVLPKLPIQWTAEKLVVNGVEYDAATHLPVLIYPHPNVPEKYLILNSGHTFHEAELKGTNAQLYPRLGDWAVIKPKPTKDDPAAAEVVAAGIFDENWQFAKE
ncbi:hypothetical protein [Limnoglobus roseus]|uniref:Alpha/beta hydrolase n=1 Tax=Limnoglobus roseus TaxID=2598579 RepID=A0A5C1AN30_9BACT|nr:hypothetical protein [Limnoglobus roseus]QEL19396.1 alpha/beta hydrolase [Limnoglobus roseus]